MKKKINDQIKLISDLADIVDQLGWVISFDGSDNALSGMIIGTHQYVADLTGEDIDGIPVLQ